MIFLTENWCISRRHGKGFAVVASEISRLATSSADTAKKIQAMDDVATAVDESAKGIGDVAGAVTEMSSNMKQNKAALVAHFLLHNAGRRNYACVGAKR